MESLFPEEDKFSFLFNSAIDLDNLSNVSMELADDVNKTYVTPVELRLLTDKSNMYITPTDFEKLPRLPQEISFLHINCRSLSNKLHDIIILNNNIKAKIIDVTETWLSSDSKSIFIPGYSFISACRSGKRGGGVGFFIHQDLHFSPINLSFNFSSFEGLFVRLELNHSSLMLGVAYRPPNNSVKVFNDEFRLLLDHITKRRNCILLGDFNLDLLETPNSTAIQEFQSTALSHCLHPKITLPTRITSTSATIIDNVFSNILDRDSIAKIIIDDISDHLPIYLSLSGCYCDSRNQVTHPLRIQSDANKMNFVNTLMKEDWV